MDKADHSKMNKIFLRTGFIILCAMTVAGIVLSYVRGFEALEKEWAFNIGIGILGMAVCTVLYFSCMLDNREAEQSTYQFISLIFSDAVALFLSECTWLMFGIPDMRWLSLIANVLFYLIGIVLVYQFWLYICSILEMEERAKKRRAVLIKVAFIIAAIMALSNLFVPFYFSIDEQGVYQRGALYPIAYIYLLFTTVVILISLIRSASPRRQKLVVASFIAAPLINQLITAGAFGISTQYAATLLAILLMYTFLFAERGKTLTAQKAELDVANRLQADMLPNIFPAFPDRKEFNIYASMTPAKEVGGDFYDFFFVDRDHLALVIADVSGKGIPAAMFMMMAKSMIQTQVMTGHSPKQVLSDVNRLICANNRENMFVTVWLGILNIKTGVITASNAGHEYPIIKTPDGEFEILKDKHGFVIGGMARMKFTEYEQQMQPGSKLFVYTDGVPEATNSAEELFGLDRTVNALNRVKDSDPMEILKSVEHDVAEFVGGAEQFDDLTMLGLEYKGEEQ